MGATKGSVLIVDDERVVLDIGRKILEEFGYEVSLAESGEQALEIVRGQPRGFDLVMLDLGMPGIGGAACLVELKKGFPYLKVVVCTGSDAGLADWAIEEGADAVLPKPYRMSSLMALVEKALAGGPHPGENAV